MSLMQEYAPQLEMSFEGLLTELKKQTYAEQNSIMDSEELRQLEDDDDSSNQTKS